MQDHKATVLVTGGAGYVGSHACKALSAAGFLPVVLDNLSRGHREFVKWGPFYEGDLGNTELVKQIIADHLPIAVLHFAAYAYVGESMDAPALYYENNVIESAMFFEALRGTDVRHIVFSSTCAVYGNTPTGICSEQDIADPISTYGRTKLIIEQMLEDYCRAYGFTATCLRYFNAAGADPDGEIGEWHEPEPHILPNILTAAASGAAVHIFGNDYETPDGTCVRDFTHVSDLAGAHVCALNQLSRNNGFSVINLGTGSGCSLLEAVQAARDVTGAEIPVEIHPRRPGDPDRAIANATNAEKKLSWTARQSDISTILSSAWSWRNKYSPQYRKV